MKKAVSPPKFASECPVTGAMKHLKGKWKFLLLWNLHQGKVLRSAELRRTIPKLTERVFLREIKELEVSGLVIRTSYPVVPPKVDYRLSKSGQGLIPVIAQLSQWSLKTRLDN